MSPIGVNRLNLDANECQDLVRSELKTRLQFAAACLYAWWCVSQTHVSNCFNALVLCASALLQAGVHHGADAFLRGSLLSGTLVCAELMALSITEMSGFCESSSARSTNSSNFVQSARFKFQPGVKFLVSRIDPGLRAIVIL